jgi:signal transduction histidine kinase
LIREYVEGLPLVNAYGSELNQVWTNLIDNAIDAVDGSGRIWIRTSQAIVVVLYGIHMSALRVFGVTLVMLAALAVHAACGFEDVLRV